MDSNRPDASTVGVARHYSSIRILNNSQIGCLSRAKSDDGPLRRPTNMDKKRKSASGRGKSLPSSFTILFVVIMQKQFDFLNSF